MHKIRQSQQDPLENEIDILINISRATTVSLSEFLDMPAVRFDVYVERFIELQRIEKMNEQSNQTRMKWNGTR